jgi:hypothetical protein
VGAGSGADGAGCGIGSQARHAAEDADNSSVPPSRPSETWGYPAPVEWVVGLEFNGSASGAARVPPRFRTVSPRCLSDPRRYPLYIMNRKDQPSPDPTRLELIDNGERFQLFRVKHPS